MLIPSWNDYDPVLNARLATGECARELSRAVHPGYGTIALDIEGPGLHDPFTVKCVTAAWHDGDRIQGVLLDPARRPDDLAALRNIVSSGPELVFHNANFDVLGLVPNAMMTLEEIGKISDTIVYARMAHPDTMVKKKLEAQAARHLGLVETNAGMTTAFKAAGYKSIEEGYLKMDIDSPVYRFGAMADTICTLRLLPLIKEAAIRQLTDHPFQDHGITERSDAIALMEREQKINRIMLRRGARGLARDLAYLDIYRNQVRVDMDKSTALLQGSGLRPGVGHDLVTHLDGLGELPADWPRTEKTGKLSSAKKHMERLEKLDHPLAQAHRHVVDSERIIGYLEKVENRSRATGRLHPQCGVLGASATGRMSYSEPELQQFPALARPIIIDDGQGLTSIDWSQIEPVTLANMSRDYSFLDPFEAGADLYEPLMRSAGIPRKPAKVGVLAMIYGQGSKSFAADIGHSVSSAAQIMTQIKGTMPESAKMIQTVTQVAQQFKQVVTVSGRILDIPMFKGKVMAYKAINYGLGQGSAYDILACAIIECERQGVADHIQLAMHDELVVDTEAAETVERIMRTPPPELVRWAGRVPVLRTDRADLGHLWHDPEKPPAHMLTIPATAC